MQPCFWKDLESTQPRALLHRSFSQLSAPLLFKLIFSSTPSSFPMFVDHVTTDSNAPHTTGNPPVIPVSRTYLPWTHLCTPWAKQPQTQLNFILCTPNASQLEFWDDISHTSDTSASPFLNQSPLMFFRRGVWGGVPWYSQGAREEGVCCGNQDTEAGLHGKAAAGLSERGVHHGPVLSSEHHPAGGSGHQM